MGHEISYGIRIGARDETQAGLRSALNRFSQFGHSAAQAIEAPFKLVHKAIEGLGKIGLAGLGLEGIKRLGEQLDGFVERGARLAVVRKSFESLSGRVGEQADRLAEKLAGAAHGMLRISDAMEVANVGLAAGLNTSQMTTMLDFVSRKAVTTGQDVAETLRVIMHGLATGQPRGIQEMGLLNDRGLEGVKAAFDVRGGKGAFEALAPAAQKAEIIRAVLADMNRQMGKIGVTGRELVFTWQAMKNHFTERVEKLALAVAKSETLKEAVRGINTFAAGLEEHFAKGGTFGQLFFGKGKTPGLFDVAGAAIKDAAENFGLTIKGYILEAISTIGDFVGEWGTKFGTAAWDAIKKFLPAWAGGDGGKPAASQPMDPRNFGVVLPGGMREAGKASSGESPYIRNMMLGGGPGAAEAKRLTQGELKQYAPGTFPGERKKLEEWKAREMARPPASQPARPTLFEQGEAALAARNWNRTRKTAGGFWQGHPGRGTEVSKKSNEEIDQALRQLGLAPGFSERDIHSMEQRLAGRQRDLDAFEDKTLALYGRPMPFTVSRRGVRIGERAADTQTREEIANLRKRGIHDPELEAQIRAGNRRRAHEEGAQRVKDDIEGLTGGIGGARQVNQDRKEAMYLAEWARGSGRSDIQAKAMKKLDEVNALADRTRRKTDRAHIGEGPVEGEAVGGDGAEPIGVGGQGGLSLRSGIGGGIRGPVALRRSVSPLAAAEHRTGGQSGGMTGGEDSAAQLRELVKLGERIAKATESISGDAGAAGPRSANARG